MADTDPRSDDTLAKALSDAMSDDWWDDVETLERFLAHPAMRARDAALRAEGSKQGRDEASGPYRCCPHCAEDIVHDVPTNGHDVPCTICRDESEAFAAGRERGRDEVAAAVEAVLSQWRPEASDDVARFGMIRAAVAAAGASDLATIRAEAREAGISQAVEWLRAGYEYGTGPEWRENGAEWIAECAALDRVAAEAGERQ